MTEQVNAETGEVEESGLVKDLRKQIKDRDKRLSEFEAKAAEAEKAARQEKLASVLKGIGAPETAAKRIPDDVAADEAQVREYLADFGFTGQQSQAQDAGKAQADAPNPDAAAWRSVQSSEAGGSPLADIGEDKVLADIQALQGQGLSAIEAYFRNANASRVGAVT